MEVENYIKIAQYSQRNQKPVNLLDAIPLSKPLAVSLELSGMCNFKCVFCPQSTETFAKSGRAKHMSRETFDRALSGLRNWGGAKIRALWLNDVGESLLNPDFVYMISQNFSSLCDSSYLTTNASILTGDKAQALLESNLTYLKISIYSVIQDKHEDITQSKINIDEILENIALFKSKRDSNKKGPFIYVKTMDVFSEENELFLEKYKQLADEISVESIMNWNGRENFINRANVKECVTPVREVCPYPFYRMFINNNGDVSSCCVDYMYELIYGNVNENPLEDIWLSQRLKDIQNDFLSRKQKSYTACSKCNFYNTDWVSVNIDSLTAEVFLNRFSGDR